MPSSSSSAIFVWYFAWFLFSNKTDSEDLWTLQGYLTSPANKLLAHPVLLAVSGSTALGAYLGALFFYFLFLLLTSNPFLRWGWLNKLSLQDWKSSFNFQLAVTSQLSKPVGSTHVLKIQTFRGFSHTFQDVTLTGNSCWSWIMSQSILTRQPFSKQWRHTDASAA